MKVGILAGGLGSRLSEETDVRPKPMVQIGGRPILWHIMRHYEHYGLRDFVIALGYKGSHVKKYFLDYISLNGSLTIDFETGGVKSHAEDKPAWRVSLIETGMHTNTGGRVKRLGPHVGGGTFMLTYGDGLCDVDLGALLEFHRSHGKLATLTAVHPVARFGRVSLDGDRVAEFSVQPQTEEGWMNGGFYVLEPEVLDYIEGDDMAWEREPLQRLAREGQLQAYRHTSFWQCMDTLREKVLLEDLWEGGRAPWKVWR